MPASVGERGRRCPRHAVKDPQAATDFLLFDDTWTRGLENVSGHRDCNSTICPGGYVYDLLRDWPLALADQLARSKPAVSLVTYPPDETVDGGSASHSREGSASDLLFAYVLEGWQRIGTSEDINYLEGFTGDLRLAWSASPAGLHLLRHSAANLRRDAGEGVEAVRSFLDHSSLAVTTTYLRRLEGTQDEGWHSAARMIGV